MNPTDENLDTLHQQRAQLAQLRDSGVLTPTQFDEANAVLERRVAPSAPARPGWPTLAAMAFGVVVLALAGYAWKGTPEAVFGNVANPQAQEHTGLAPADAEQIAAMTEKLAQRLQAQPEDVEGWTMLGRAYRLLGRYPEAIAAYASAYKLYSTEPHLLVEYAETIAMANNNLGGQPMELIERALQIDPNNAKGLYLAGTQAFDTQEYARAVALWEKLATLLPADDAMAQSVAPAIAQARQLAGMPPTPARETSREASKATPAQNASAVSGTVTLAAALAAQAQPEDTVFVFARAAEGPRMPLAILRKQVKDLPLAFTLDDSTAMSAANALSSAGTVVVGARISKSGNAMPQSGDLQGQSEPVAVGASGLRIEIREVVKP